MTLASGIKQRCFSEEVLDVAIHFQLTDLGRQLFVWVGSDEGQLSNLYLAGLPRQGEQVPPVAALMPGGAACASETFSQRLAARFRKPVSCSLNVPQNLPHMQELIEKRVVEALMEMM
ncbi:hypothetical protein BSKO_10137 [Bryopsis sp. KO-2023]|nr:hypothetical protein BSKO_10137 [Bryopsis sp. KO-2023]